MVGTIKELVRPIRSWWYSVSAWFRDNCNKYHYDTVKAAFNSRPWDFQYLLYIEEAAIDEMIYYFSNHQTMIDEQYNKIMRTLKWAKSCIHIMNNDSDYFTYEHHTIEEFDLEKTCNSYRYLGPPLNKKNANRFFNKKIIESNLFKKGNMDHELYVEKAKHLYYLLRREYTGYWWD